MPILGLVSTENYTDADYRRKNIRRSVQYQYPNGAMVLTGLLSLLDEDETNDPSFSHWEDRYVERKTLTATSGVGGTGPFTTSAGASPGDPATLTYDTSYRVYVDDVSWFRVGNVIKIGPVDQDAGTTVEVRGIITAVNATNNYITFTTIHATGANYTGISNGSADNLDKEVLVIGSAYAEGRESVSGEVYALPVKFTNYTQIFRTPFQVTRNVLKTPVKYDVKGPFQDKAKKHAIQHMTDIEYAFLFGHRTERPHATLVSETVSTTTGAGLPLRTTGGVIYYLERWEAGDYGSVTATSDSDDDKRIIENSTGLLTEKLYDSYLERLFRNTNNTSNEKLCLCGNAFLLTLNQMYRSKSVLNADLPLTDTYGMNIVRHITPFGTVYYKTHPLFNKNNTLRYNGLFLDVGNLHYRPFVDSDTTLLKNRQANDADYRKDEWFTEAGLELWFPESHMYIKNVRDFTP